MSLVVIGSSAEPGWNVQNIGSDRVISVNVTLGIPTVTSAALFPANIVGLGGFLVLLNGVEYTVAYVSSTSSLTLTANYAGITTTLNMTLFKWVEMRVYCDRDFQPFGAAYSVGAGSPGSSAIYKRFACGIVNSAGVNYLRFPRTTIDATVDGSPTNQARYFFGVYRPDGSFVQPFPNLDSARVPVIPSPTTLEAIGIYNHPPDWPPFPEQYYTQNQIDQRLPGGTQGQILVFPQTGVNLAAFTLGGGFTVDFLNRIVNVATGSSFPNRVITTSDALQSGDGVVFLDCTSGPITLQLLNAATVANKIFYIQKIDASANAGTIDPNGAETINGVATLSLPRQWAAALIYSTGSTWRVLAGNLLTNAGVIRSVTSTTTLLSSDGTVLCNAASGAITVNGLAASSVPGQTFVIKKTDASVNTVIFDPAGAETVNGYGTWILLSLNETLTIQSNGSNWEVIE